MMQPRMINAFSYPSITATEEREREREIRKLLQRRCCSNTISIDPAGKALVVRKCQNVRTCETET
jgi:hypothetical protein